MKKFVILSALTLVFVAYLVQSLGVFLKAEEIDSGFKDCSYLQTSFDITGNEDSVLFGDDILIGTHGNLVKLETYETLTPQQSGGFYAVYGLKTGNLVAKQVKVRNFPSDILFLPHGIYLRNSAHIYVINHSYETGGERIEKYLIVQEESGDISLEYLHSTKMEAQFYGITNDLVVLSNDRFLISDWNPFPITEKGKYHEGLWKKIVTLLIHIFKINTTYIWDCTYKSGETATCKKVDNSAGIMNNGLAFDGRSTIVVSDSVPRVVRIFKLEGNGEIKYVQTLSTTMMGDNINYDKHSNNFIIGGMNSPLEFLGLRKQLDKIQLNKSNKPSIDCQGIIETLGFNSQTYNYEVKPLFSSSKTIVGLSGAHINSDNKVLLINSFIDKGIMVCTKK